MNQARGGWSCLPSLANAAPPGLHVRRRAAPVFSSPSETMGKWSAGQRHPSAMSISRETPRLSALHVRLFSVPGYAFQKAGYSRFDQPALRTGSKSHADQILPLLRTERQHLGERRAAADATVDFEPLEQWKRDRDHGDMRFVLGSKLQCLAHICRSAQIGLLAEPVNCRERALVHHQ